MTLPDHPYPLALPDAALDADIAILGRKGGGKTYTAKGLVERLLDMGRRVLVLDPLGVWAGLRTAADGNSPGYPVAIFGGALADLPLDPAAAEPLARIIAAENLPAVFDLSDLTKSAQQTFLYRFLHELRRTNTDALTIVLEEADVFAPQNPLGDDSKALHGEIDWIARRGRFKGFRLLTVTQRPARLSKDVLTQCSTLIAHRLPAPQDREAVKAWVDGNGDRERAREVYDTLASLAVGEAWVWAPEHDILSRMHFPAIRTLDTSATPKAGEIRVEPKTLAQVDVSSIKAALAAAAPQKAAGGGRQVQAPDAQALATARAEGYAAGLSDGRQEGANGERSRIRDAIEALFGAAEGNAILPVPKPDPAPRVVKAPMSAPRPVRELTTDLPSAAIRMLTVLDTQPPIRMSWNALAASIGNKARGGHFNTVRKALLDRALVVEVGNLVQIATPSARAAPPMTQDEMAVHLRAQWKSILGGRPAQIIDVLNDNGPSTMRAVADWLGCAASGGHWNSAWKMLRDNDLVVEDAGRMRLHRDLARDEGMKGR